MSNIYQDVETAIVAKLTADAWIAANVKTLATDLPETLLPAVDFTEIFQEEKLPALVVLTALENAAIRSATLGELRYEIPFKALGVLMRRKKAEARNAAQELAGQAERVLNACRTSAAALAISGRGNFVSRISSTADVRKGLKGARRYYGLVTVDGLVTVIREL